MKWYHWLLMMLASGLFVWGCTMAVHAEDAAGPKWKIVVILDGPPGKQELTYGNQQEGVHWFKDRDECEAARKGGDKKFAEGMKRLAKIQADFRKQKVAIEVTAECRLDDSV